MSSETPCSSASTWARDRHGRLLAGAHHVFEDVADDGADAVKCLVLDFGEPGQGGEFGDGADELAAPSDQVTQ